MSHRPIYYTGLVCLALMCAAGSCRPAPDAAASTDGGRAAWTAEPTPRLHIGGRTAPGHELDRVYGGALLPDGGVVVGNSGTGELRFFDRAGTLTHTAGRKGRGPGEFRAVSWLQPYRGDSLLVFDLFLQRFSVWTQTGSFARSFQLPVDRPASRAVGVFPDGGILFAAEVQPDPRATQGLVRAEFDLVRVDPLGEHAASVGRFAGNEWLLYKTPMNFAATQPPFARMGHAAVGGESVLYASSDSGVVRVYGEGGRLVRTFPVPVGARSLDRREVAQALEGIRDRGEREAIRRYTQDLANASALRIQDLRVDRSGNVWIRTHTAARETSRWVVMALSGEQIGSIDLPSGSMPLDIAQDVILLRETDDDGVQRVSLRGITR